MIPPLKTWLRRDEFMELAACYGSDAHTAENPSPEELDTASQICASCDVRVECIEWAIKNKINSVVVAGTYLVDPENRRELKEQYGYLKRSLPQERRSRGAEI